MLEFLLTGDAIMALLTLTFLEIILGIDNIVFISIAANKLPEHQRNKATNIGLVLAMVQRIILLFFVSFLVGLSKPFYNIETNWFELHISWQALILFIGGLFLIYKSTSEIREKVTHPGHDEDNVKGKKIKDTIQCVGTNTDNRLYILNRFHTHGSGYDQWLTSKPRLHFSIDGYCCYDFHCYHDRICQPYQKIHRYQPKYPNARIGVLDPHRIYANHRGRSFIAY